MQTLTNLEPLPEQNPNAVLEVDLSGKLLYANPAARQSFPDIEEGTPQHPLMRDLETILATLERTGLEWLEREIEVDGKTYTRRIYRVPNDERVRIFLHDITQQKRATNELQKLSRVVEQSPASVVITDTQGTIEYVNPKFTQLTEYTAEEVIGQNPRLWKSDKTPIETYQQLWKAITSGREWCGELCNRKRMEISFGSVSPFRRSMTRKTPLRTSSP